MKIGFVLDDSLDKPDGVQQYILTLGRWYTSVGHEVHYLVGKTRRDDIANVHSLSRNIHVRFNQNRMSIPLPANKSQLRDILNREKFDVLHIQMPFSPMLAGRIIKSSPVTTSIVGTFHIVPFSRLQSWATYCLGIYVRRLLRRFDNFIAVSSPAGKFAKKTFGINSLIVPNAVDTLSMSRGKIIDKFDDNKINIIFLGRLVERKGCLQLLKAIQLLHLSHQLNNVRVLICGKGPLDNELQNFVHENRLGAVVHFVGFVSETDKADYLATANIAVFPSLGGESFGIVLVEAMSAGSQVVLAGNNIGYKSVIGNHPEQLVEPLNTLTFATSLKHFILNSRARQSASHWQKLHANQYDVRVVGTRLLEIYEESIAKRSKSINNNDNK